MQPLWSYYERFGSQLLESGDSAQNQLFEHCSCRITDYADISVRQALRPNFRMADNPTNKPIEPVLLFSRSRLIKTARTTTRLARCHRRTLRALLRWYEKGLRQLRTKPPQLTSGSPVCSPPYSVEDGLGLHQSSFRRFGCSS